MFFSEEVINENNEEEEKVHTFRLQKKSTCKTDTLESQQRKYPNNLRNMTICGQMQ